MVKEAAEAKAISIHAPLRERLVMLVLVIIVLTNFNPRSLAGATRMLRALRFAGRDFNPRSLTGATQNL